MSFGKFKEKQNEIIETFEGGLNTKASITDLPLTQTPDAQNVSFDDFGNVETRLGRTLVNTAPIGSLTVDGIFSYNPSVGSAQLLAAANSAHKLSGTTFVTIASSESLFTAGVDVEIHQFCDLAFFSNGEDRAYKYNGTDFTRMGVSATTQTLSAGGGGAGTLTGDYAYTYAGVNSFGAEGNIGVVSNTFTAAANAIDVSNIPTAPASHGIESWNIYRNTAATEGLYLKVTSISNGVTSFVDNNDDSTLLVSAPLDSAPPGEFKYFANYQGYLFAAGDPSDPDAIRWSRINQPEEWPIDNRLLVGKGDGQNISGINVITGSIIITKSSTDGSNSTYTLFNDDPDPINWYLLKTDSPYGSESHKAMTRWDNQLSLYNRDGFFGFNGISVVKAAGTTEFGAIKVDSVSFDIEPTIQAVKKSTISEAAAINFENKIYLSTTTNSASTENDVIFVFDYVRASTSSRKIGAWIPFTNHNIQNFTIHEDELYGGSSLADGFVYKLVNGRSDNGEAIDSFYTTAPFKGKEVNESRKKVWRHLYFWADTPGAWDLKVTPIVDFEMNPASIDVDLTPDATSLWGTAVWGQDTWGGPQIRKRFRVDLNSIGYYFQIKFSTNTANQYYKIYRVQLFYNLKGKQ